MAVTLRQPSVQCEAGTYTGTGAAISFNLGFKPMFIFVYNETDGDVCWVGIRGIGSGDALQINTAASFISSNGITFNEQGFTVGTTLSENGKLMRYFVM